MVNVERVKEVVRYHSNIGADRMLRWSLRLADKTLRKSRYLYFKDFPRMLTHCLGAFNILSTNPSMPLPQKVQPNSHPQECGLDVVTCSWGTESGKRKIELAVRNLASLLLTKRSWVTSAETRCEGHIPRWGVLPDSSTLFTRNVRQAQFKTVTKGLPSSLQNWHDHEKTRKDWETYG